ncbi:hypothetical protein AABB24_035217 [Solanum stoloniferum]|uniref:Uncharacterized protein n=1 Tax=Solanum stoloniferum TaxID=62892 RepID=A0ABD2R7Q9_9SOLN
MYVVYRQYTCTDGLQFYQSLGLIRNRHGCNLPMLPCQDKALTISTANPIAQKRKRYYHQSHKFLPVLTLISCCLVHKTFQQQQEQEKISVKLNRSFGVSC